MLTLSYFSETESVNILVDVSHQQYLFDIILAQLFYWRAGVVLEYILAIRSVYFILFSNKFVNWRAGWVVWVHILDFCNQNMFVFVANSKNKK